MQKSSKIKGDVLSICFFDVLSAYLETLMQISHVLSIVILMFKEKVHFFWTKIDVLSICPSLYIYIFISYICTWRY